MRILIYGFGPYKQFQENITQRVLGKLPARSGVRQLVFPVRFDKKQFASAVERFRPDIILGLGQCSNGRLLRIEQRAVNRKRNDRKERARPIVLGGPKWLPTTLRLEKLALGKQAKISRDAGDYVCNFSMYVILAYLWLRMAIAAQSHSDGEFAKAKLATCEFYFKRLLPRTITHRAAVEAGSECLMSLPAEAFMLG